MSRGAIPPYPPAEWLESLPLLDLSTQDPVLGIYAGEVMGHTNPVFLYNNGELDVAKKGSDLWEFDEEENDFVLSYAAGGIANAIIQAAELEGVTSGGAFMINKISWQKVTCKLMPA